MPIAYFDFAGKPARVVLDNAQTPQSCEVYDASADAFVPRDELTLDVLNSYDARLIAQAEFETLLEKARARAGERR